MRHYLPLFLRRTLAKLFARHFQIKQILILLVCIVTSLFFIIYWYISNEKNFRIVNNIYVEDEYDGRKLDYGADHERDFVSRSVSESCWPIKSNVNQYSVVLEGRKYPKSVLLHRNASIDFDCLNRRQKEKIIFVRNSLYNDPGFFYGLNSAERFSKMNCPVNRCVLINDSTRVDEADIFLVSMVDNFTKPATRKASDRYVFMLYESSVQTKNMGEYNGFFNFTSTHMQDSDFPGMYESQAKMTWQPNPTFDESLDFSRGKSRTAAILVSNCHAKNRRMEIVQLLKRFIKVDVFGECGEPCPAEFEKNCRQYIAENYKFYLAFENSNCDDYITEKFFEILQYNIIPVVYGGGTYEDYVPKSGFINVLDFKSTRHLAEHLIYLDRNATAYNAYFSWKKHVLFSVNSTANFSPICDICVHLLLEDYLGVTQKSIGDIGTYWSPKRNCLYKKKNLN